MYRHKIPLHLDQQDHLIFGLTARQVIILGCGVAIGYTLFNSLIASTTWGLAFGAILALSIITPAILTAFLQANGRNFEQWAIIYLLYLASPKVFLWQTYSDDALSPKAPNSEQNQPEKHQKENEEW